METIGDVIARLRAEYLEMPGLRLKPGQVRRLCGIEQTPCQMALELLVDTQFLRVSADGHYTRVTDGEMSRPRAVKAELRSEPRVVKVS
jgi:hypothetical protein